MKKQISSHARLISQLVGHCEQDWLLLQEEVDQIVAWVPDVVQVFFDTLYECDETRAVFREGDRSHLEKVISAWLFDIVSGYQEEEFWEYQWTIALVHIRRNIKNIYVLGIMNRLQLVILEKCLETFDADRAIQIYKAFFRITGITIALIVECYTELQEQITEDGLARAGVTPRLLSRIRENTLKAMLQEALEDKSEQQGGSPGTDVG